MVWNQSSDISEVYLYSEPLRLWVWAPREVTGNIRVPFATWNHARQKVFTLQVKEKEEGATSRARFASPGPGLYEAKIGGL